MSGLKLTREQVEGNRKMDCMDNRDVYVQMPTTFAKWIYQDWLAMDDLLTEIYRDMESGKICWTGWRKKINALIGGE